MSCIIPYRGIDKRVTKGMKMKITFGKYSGRDTEYVAMVDPDYCIWAANNLKSSTWQKEFSAALKAVKNRSAEEIAKARYNAQYDEVEEPDYGAILEEVEHEKAMDEWSRQCDAVAANYANRIGTTADKLKSLYFRYANEMDMISARNFSSPQKYQLFVEFVTAYDAVPMPS